MTDEDKKISGIYQEADSVEPPAHLDDAILSASRSAVESTSRARGPFSGGWPVPASIAAVVIVAIIVVPVVMQEATQETSIPASTEMMKRDNLKGQQLNSPPKPQAPPMRMMQSSPDDNRQVVSSPEIGNLGEIQIMEQQLESVVPAATSPSPSTYEMDSLSRDASAGRLNKQSEPAESMQERKAIITQNLKKKEREERIRSPEDWLAYIEELFAANEIEKAKLEIKAFTLAYPDYNIESEFNDSPD